MQQVLHGWGRDRGYFWEKGEGKIQGQSLLQAAGAEEGSPQPPRPHHLVRDTRGHELITGNSALQPSFIVHIFQGKD